MHSAVISFAKFYDPVDNFRLLTGKGSICKAQAQKRVQDFFHDKLKRY